MSGLGLSGLASGVDTGTMVDRLMAIERQGLTKMRWRESAIKARETTLKDLQSRVSALQGAGRDLAKASLWSETQLVTSSEATRVTGTRTGPVASGEYTVEVRSLATVEQRAYAFTAQALPQTLSLTRQGAPTVQVALSAGATVTDAAAAINASADAPVSASVVAGKLQLTSKQSGAPGSFTASGADTLGTASLAEDVTQARAGTDAVYVLNGTTKTSPSNVAEDAVPGLRLNLLNVTATGAPARLTVGAAGLKLDEIKAEVKQFVEAYNGLVGFVRDKTSEKRVPNAANAVEAAKGQFFGDRGLGGLLANLRGATSERVAGAPAAFDELAEIGLSTGRSTGSAPSQDALTGKLSLDETKLTAALETDAVSVQRLLGGLTGAPGLAQRIEALTEAQLDTSGLLPARLKGATEELNRVRDQMTRTDERLVAKEKRLRAQFAGMEKALGQAQTQQAWLAGQLAGLPTW